MLTKDDVGTLFTRHGDDAWRLVAITPRGNAVMEHLEAEHCVVGAPNSPALENFKRLVVEEK